MRHRTRHPARQRRRVGRIPETVEIGEILISPCVPLPTIEPRVGWAWYVAVRNAGVASGRLDATKGESMQRRLAPRLAAVLLLASAAVGSSTRSACRWPRPRRLRRSTAGARCARGSRVSCTACPSSCSRTFKRDTTSTCRRAEGGNLCCHGSSPSGARASRSARSSSSVSPRLSAQRCR